MDKETLKKITELFEYLEALYYWEAYYFSKDMKDTKANFSLIIDYNDYLDIKSIVKELEKEKWKSFT